MTGTVGPGPDGAAPSPDASSERRHDVEIEVDGRLLTLKDFLHDMVGGAALGLVSGLRGVDSPREIRISVRRR